MPRRRLGSLRQASKNWMVLIKVSAPFRRESSDMLSLIISFHIKSWKTHTPQIRKWESFSEVPFFMKRKVGKFPVTLSDQLLPERILVSFRPKQTYFTVTLSVFSGLKFAFHLWPDGFTTGAGTFHSTFRWGMASVSSSRRAGHDV